MRHIVFNDKNYLITCSTDGPISIWDIEDILANIEFVTENKVIEESPKPVYTINAYQRIISLDAHLESQIHANDPKPKSETPNNGVEEGKKGNHKQKNGKSVVDKEEENTNAKLDKKSKKIKKVTFEEPQKEKVQPKAEKKVINLGQPETKSKKNKKRAKKKSEKLVVEYDNDE